MHLTVDQEVAGSRPVDPAISKKRGRMNKILFLDMDGVLNSTPPVKSRKRKRKDADRALYGIDVFLARRLRKIIQETGCKIVFSTSWRYFKDHPVEGSDWRKTLLDELKCDERLILGDTPDMSYMQASWTWGTPMRRRGREIKAWIDANPDYAVPGNFRFCVIDDVVDDITNVIDESHVVNTDYRRGLQNKDVERAISILNG